jgi:hypothetical protein
VVFGQFATDTRPLVLEKSRRGADPEGLYAVQFNHRGPGALDGDGRACRAEDYGREGEPVEGPAGTRLSSAKAG